MLINILLALSWGFAVPVVALMAMEFVSYLVQEKC